MDKGTVVEQVRKRYALAAGTSDERGRRALAASEALTLGWGGVALVARATGLSRTTIGRGVKELRGAGGRRKRTVAKDSTVLADLERLVEPTARGDPQSPLRWTCKSLRRLAAELGRLGHRASHQWVADALVGLGYHLQGNRKTREEGDHPDRDAQFAHINDTAAAFLAAGDPVIAVDAKKKELVGDFTNGGREWRPKGAPEQVQVYDFPSKDLGRVTPYGVSDLAANAGWVSVGLAQDTAAFAVATIRRWWEQVGKARYPRSDRLLITADSGGSNGSRTRLWKRELQQLADQTGLAITVCHYPPGTSKWNNIEHRRFAFITQNWRGRPLVSYAVILSLIAGTTTSTGLSVQSYLDTATYPTGSSVSDEEMDAFHIERDSFHPNWNYTIRPRVV